MCKCVAAWFMLGSGGERLPAALYEYLHPDPDHFYTTDPANEVNLADNSPIPPKKRYKGNTPIRVYFAMCLRMTPLMVLRDALRTSVRLVLVDSVLTDLVGISIQGLGHIADIVVIKTVMVID